MRKYLFPVVAAGTLALGGCAAGYGQDPLTQVLGSVLGSSAGYPQGGYPQGGYPQGGYGYPQGGYGNSNQSFEQAAVNACASQAGRYGRVGISDVRQQSSSTLRVRGTIEVNNSYQRRSFGCSFRSDGRITDFDI